MFSRTKGSVRGLSLTAVLICALAGVVGAKDLGFTGDGARDGREGGESWDDAVSVGNMPYTDSGMTCDNHWDVDFSCGYTAGLGPDVFYKFRACCAGVINVTLCGSGFDTELAIFDSQHNELACNDDFCGLQSEIDGFQIASDEIYYIVVSGFYGSCGSYVITVTGPECDCSGVCCAADGTCTVTYPWMCQGTFISELFECDPNPCSQPTPADAVTWGRIKGRYR
jgi:hypothetical protein